ncbi:MAG: phosphoribosyltransferase [Planctomycetes bacterium]|nr:phosphoribosyltransferase [Planctomycetota bacterium]
MFRDRADAGWRMAAKLKEVPLHDPVVLGIPRGGVAIGAVLAEELGAELDIVLARKLRAPGQPELAIGALSETGEVQLNDRAAEVWNVDDDYLKEEIRTQKREIARRQKLFREVRPRVPLAGRSVIVTDDGIATGATMIAALKVLRGQEAEQQAREVIVAVPVAAADRLREIRPLCDRLVCLLQPESFLAIGQFYSDFTQVADADVVKLLDCARALYSSWRD